jgi:hypothetical protein
MQSPFFVVMLSIFAFVLFYFIFFRSWQLRWGATDDEIKRSIPGDDIVISPSFNATRTVTINAPAENIYPWIVQMGVNRAGWYSYDLLDNLARKSAKIILPEYQNLQTGDLVPMSPDGKYGIWVKDFRKDEWILWWDKIGDTSWVWAIYSEGDNRCRLVTRVRMKYRWLSFSAPFNLLIEFFDMPMMRKCMLGIKRRAESKALF